VALGLEELDDHTAISKVTRAWARSVRGLKVRVEVEGQDNHVVAHRHMEGHMSIH